MRTWKLCCAKCHDQTETKAPVTRYRIRIGAISILGVFQSCLLLKLFIFDVFV